MKAFQAHRKELIYSVFFLNLVPFPSGLSPIDDNYAEIKNAILNRNRNRHKNKILKQTGE